MLPVKTLPSEKAVTTARWSVRGIAVLQAAEEPTGSRERFEERRHDVTREQDFARRKQAGIGAKASAQRRTKSLPILVTSACRSIS